MVKVQFKKIVAIILVLAMICTSTNSVFGLTTMSNCFEGRVFVSDVQTPLAPGAVEHVVTTNNKTGTDQNIDFIGEIDLKETDSIKLMSCYAGYQTLDQPLGEEGSWSYQMMTIPEQAQKAQAYFDAHQDKYPNYKIVGALVGDTYNMGTGQPTSTLVMEGNTYQKPNGSWYFAVDKQGNAKVTNSTDTSNIQTAVGGMGLIVKDGQNVARKGDTYTDSSFSRAAIGIKDDGTVLTFCTYGNSYPISCGYTWSEVADYLIAQGCKDALMLDGSGSAEWCARAEGEDNVVSRSHPSDGNSRSVGSCILIVSTATPDGVFARANITPSETVYTPNSAVSFQAVGADSAGNHVDIPSGATWSLADSNYGSINENTGEFTSNGTTGDVEVQLLFDNKVVGKSVITIAEPDSITFTQENIELGRKEVSNLGMQVRYQNRNVVLKAGDLKCSLTNDSGDSEPIGTFDTNTNLFTSAEKTCSGTVTISSAFNEDISATANITVGKDPVKALDFEPVEGQTLAEYYGLDEENYVVGRAGDTQTATPATGLLTRLHYSGRRTDEVSKQETARIVSVADGYPAHSGENSLQVNYDFSNCLPGKTEGANVGMSSELSIPGNPTAIGLWVYVPKNTPNLWLRVRLKITPANGGEPSYTQFDFGEQINVSFPAGLGYGGLTECEEGTWVFCQADLSSYKGCSFAIPTGEAIRLMRTDGATVLSNPDSTKTANQSHGKYLRDGTEVAIENCKGSVYFDDLMFIYGDVNADTTAPDVKEATYNEDIDRSSALTDGKQITWNKDASYHAFKFFIADETGKNDNNTPSGIDFNSCFLYIDGELMNGKTGTVFDVSTSSITSYANLSNGEHTIRLLLSDKNGNRRNKYYNFTVTGNDEIYPTFSVETESEIAPLGGKVPVRIHASERAGTRNVQVSMAVDNRYSKGGYIITPAEGYTYDGNASFNEVDNTITFTITGDGNVSGEGDIATVRFDIDKTLAPGSYFTYSVTSGIVTGTNPDGASEDYHAGFTSKERKLKVDAPYSISSDLLYAGMQGGAIYVKDKDDNGVSNANVYKLPNDLLGVTDAEGKLVLSDEFLAEPGRYTLYAENPNGISFNKDIEINSVSQLNSEVIYTAVNDSTTCKNFSWISTVNSNVKVRYAVSQEALEGSGAIEAKVVKNKLRFNTGNQVAQINKVALTDLKPDTSYYYQISMDNGENWSDVKTFKTDAAKDSSRFFVLGDAQASDLTNINTIIEKLANDGYDFGVQTGDLVDVPTNIDQWISSMGLFNGLNDLDMIYALGNHENNMGDDGSLAKEIYQMKDKSYYSVEYGNVYVANISYNSADGYKKVMNWLVSDAQASDAQWKIVVMHQPTYYTNSTATDNLGMDKLMPEYFQKAGINVVFSGHDHSYARTVALKDGERAESYDEETATSLKGDGIVYYICGSTGEKSYPIDSTLPFDFATLNGDFEAIYLSVNATEENLEISTYDLVNGVPTVIDSYTMYASECEKVGHSFDENSEYDINAKTLTCSVCGKPAPIESSGYTGLVRCGDKQVSVIAGKIQTGWITLGEDVVHAGDNGIIHDTKSFTTETCTENGTRIAYCTECNLKRSYGTTVRYHNHSYDDSYKCTNTYYDENMQLHECTWTGVDINSEKLNITLGYNYGFYSGKPLKPLVTITNENGDKLINQSTYGDYVSYYSNNTDVGVASIKLVGYNSYYGEKTIKFEIRPSNVADINVEKVLEDRISLSWEKSLGAEKYAVYQSEDGTNWKRIANVEDNNYEVTGLRKDTTYYFKIRPFAIVEDTLERLDGSHNTYFYSTRDSNSVEVTTLIHNEHIASTQWSFDSENHWHSCTCGIRMDEGSHVAGPQATATTPQVCTICGYVIKAATGGGGILVPSDPTDTKTETITTPEGDKITTTTTTDKETGAVTEKVETVKTDGSKSEVITETKTEEKADGSVVKTESTVTTETDKDGNTTEVSVEKESVTNADGTTSEKTTTTNADKSQEIVEVETATNSFDNKVEAETTTTISATGEKTVEQTTTIQTQLVGEITVGVKKDAEGNVTDATADITRDGKAVAGGVKTLLNGNHVKQIVEALDDDVEEITITTTVKNENGDKAFSITANTADLKAEKALYIVAVDKNGKQTLVNAKTYNVTGNGSVSLTLKDGADYQLISKEEKVALVKAIKATIAPTSTKKTVAKGKTSTMSLKKTLNKANVSKITYSTSSKSVATVSKSGKITAKKKGTVTIKATVTLKDGSKKTVSTKVAVK